MEKVSNTNILKKSENRTPPEPEIVHSFGTPEDTSKPYAHAVIEIDGLLYVLVRCSDISAMYAGGLSRVASEALQRTNNLASSGIENTGSTYPVKPEKGAKEKLFERRFRLHLNNSLL